MSKNKKTKIQEVGTQAVENQALEIQEVETQALEIQEVETQALEIQEVETQEVETQAVAQPKRKPRKLKVRFNPKDKTDARVGFWRGGILWGRDFVNLELTEEQYQRVVNDPLLEVKQD